MTPPVVVTVKNVEEKLKALAAKKGVVTDTHDADAKVAFWVGNIAQQILDYRINIPVERMSPDVSNSQAVLACQSLIALKKAMLGELLGEENKNNLIDAAIKAHEANMKLYENKKLGFIMPVSVEGTYQDDFKILYQAIIGNSGGLDTIVTLNPDHVTDHRSLADQVIDKLNPIYDNGDYPEHDPGKPFIFDDGTEEHTGSRIFSVMIDGDGPSLVHSQTLLGEGDYGGFDTPTGDDLENGYDRMSEKLKAMRSDRVTSRSTIDEQKIINTWLAEERKRYKVSVESIRRPKFDESSRGAEQGDQVNFESRCSSMLGLDGEKHDPKDVIEAINAEQLAGLKGIGLLDGTALSDLVIISPKGGSDKLTHAGAFSITPRPGIDTEDIKVLKQKAAQAVRKAIITHTNGVFLGFGKKTDWRKVNITLTKNAKTLTASVTSKPIIQTKTDAANKVINDWKEKKGGRKRSRTSSDELLKIENWISEEARLYGLSIDENGVVSAKDGELLAVTDFELRMKQMLGAGKKLNTKDAVIAAIKAEQSAGLKGIILSDGTPLSKLVIISPIPQGKRDKRTDAGEFRITPRGSISEDEKFRALKEEAAQVVHSVFAKAIGQSFYGYHRTPNWPQVKAYLEAEIPKLSPPTTLSARTVGSDGPSPSAAPGYRALSQSSLKGEPYRQPYDELLSLSSADGSSLGSLPRGWSDSYPAHLAALSPQGVETVDELYEKVQHGMEALGNETGNTFSEEIGNAACALFKGETQIVRAEKKADSVEVVSDFEDAVAMVAGVVAQTFIARNKPTMTLSCDPEKKDEFAHAVIGMIVKGYAEKPKGGSNPFDPPQVVPDFILLTINGTQINLNLSNCIDQYNRINLVERSDSPGFFSSYPGAASSNPFIAERLSGEASPLPSVKPKRIGRQ